MKIFCFSDIIGTVVLSSHNFLRMKSLEKSGFTLIEVLVASLLLSTVFFAILTLISNNSRQAVNLERSKIMDELFLSSKACIQSFGYTSATATQSVNFGADNMGCFTGTYNDTFSFTGIALEKMSDTESGSITFWSYFHIVDNTGFLKVYNTLMDGTEKRDYDFIVGK